MNVMDFHILTRWVLLGWLVVFGVRLAMGVLPPLAFYVISCFEMAPRHHQELLYAAKSAAIWLIPTAFIALAASLSRRGALGQ